MIRIHRGLMTDLRERQHPLSMHIALTFVWGCGPLAVSPCLEYRAGLQCWGPGRSC